MTLIGPRPQLVRDMVFMSEEQRMRHTAKPGLSGLTLHGLIGLNDSVSAPAYEKQIERDFLIKAEKNNIPISVISSGMKARIE